MMKLTRFKPAVNKSTLLFIAGFLWIAIGTMLLTFSYTWIKGLQSDEITRFAGAGLFIALLIHHFGFLKIVDKNLGRLLPRKGKQCVFSFMPWKSYLLIATMILLGTLVRHSNIPKPYLSVLYTAIGLALILSSIRYLRFLLMETRSTPPMEEERENL